MKGAAIRDRIGGGNLVTHLAGKSTQLYQALHGVGARMGRMDSYGWRTLARAPTPHDFDAAMLEAHKNGITPLILLEYEGSYQTLNPTQPIGSYQDWFAAGQAMAKRFRPGGEWGQDNGIPDWGATIFTAINEPDVQASIPRKDYHDALAGLADGVHSVDPKLRVVPGGFATCNSHGDATLRGYGPAIADLLADGRLDGIDLHTYYNDRWYPMTRGRAFSAQTCFDRIKQAMGLTRDVNFYTTEFNVARAGAWADEKVAAKLFLSAIWDQLAVVGKDGRTPVSAVAFPWNVGDTPDVDGLAYAMASGADPWVPEARSVVLKTVLQLAGHMKIVSIDRQLALYRLSGADADLIVWQNIAGWTDRPGRAVEIDLPAWARSLEVWGWDGLQRRIDVTPGRFFVDGLNADETYMFRVPRP
ncbi:hypothetical protein SSBR45G_16870 [Bradyrhizobium sp. SSBR45G]|uniref:hypothetical protein n=1 Tax=unclassified Bradyrhizobium TaxID=2631580 RepID=UPI002342B75E|nr:MULTISPECIES: hypothetical protein [unclassified Bradyrhizobium]GLH76779.1 hypothetical protein SSBR45G_16870 [Bradyrhizobium sp. SSBR45G]GLH83537.1 hypothetical protein SSBR45R_09970 [Bradyrhizobium sp. SSBR45R]